MERAPHEQRVIDEKIALDEKGQKLVTFLQSPAFGKLSNQEALLLVRQKDIMVAYSDILAERIALFPSS